MFYFDLLFSQNCICDYVSQSLLYQLPNVPGWFGAAKIGIAAIVSVGGTYALQRYSRGIRLAGVDFDL